MTSSSLIGFSTFDPSRPLRPHHSQSQSLLCQASALRWTLAISPYMWCGSLIVFSTSDPPRVRRDQQPLGGPFTFTHFNEHSQKPEYNFDFLSLSLCPVTTGGAKSFFSSLLLQSLCLGCLMIVKALLLLTPGNWQRRGIQSSCF